MTGSRRPSPARLSLLLGLSIAGVLAVWRLWPTAEGPAIATRRPAHDDLQLLSGSPEDRPAATAPSGRDLLVATPAGLVVANAHEGSVAATPKAAAPPVTVARADGGFLAIAAAGDTVWAARAGAPGRGRSGSVLRVSFRGGDGKEVASGLGRPHDIACDGRWLVVVDEDLPGESLSRGTAIERFPAAGGERVVLGRSEGEVANVALDLDAQAVYWANTLEGTIVTTPLAGGEPRVLSAERGLPERVVVSGDALFWVEKRSESLWTMPKAGGTPHQVVQDFAGFASFVVAAGSVAWVNEEAVTGGFRVFQAPAGAGTATETTPMTAPVDASIAIASDGARVFWATWPNDGGVAVVAPVIAATGGAR